MSDVRVYYKSRIAGVNYDRRKTNPAELAKVTTAVGYPFTVKQIR